MPPLHEGDPTFRDEAPHVSHGHSKALGHLVDVQKRRPNGRRDRLDTLCLLHSISLPTYRGRSWQGAATDRNERLRDEVPRHKPFERERELGAAIENGKLNRFPTPLACETVAATPSQ